MTLVCDCCGSANIYDEQRSVDDRWLVGRCRCHKGMHPLVSEGSYVARKRRPVQAAPSDLFGDLSESERADLRRSVKFGSIGRDV